MRPHYAGLDVSDKLTSVCVIDEEGNIVVETVVETSAAAIAKAIAPYRKSIAKLAQESGARAPWLQRELERRRLPIVCLDARAASGMLKMQRNKTDRNDARALAQVVRAGWCRVAHVKSEQAFRMRMLLTNRRQLKRKAGALLLCLRGSLKVFGARLERGKGGIRVLLPARRKDSFLEAVAAPMLRSHGMLMAEVTKLDAMVAACAKEDAVCRRLMTTPGVGPITALTFRAAIDDPGRFKRSRDVAAHFGLTPRRYQSGQIDVSGGISHMGDRNVRSALYEAAFALLVNSKSKCRLRTWGLRLRREKGLKLAAIAVARKLAVIMHRMWVTACDFDHSPA